MDQFTTISASLDPATYESWRWVCLSRGMLLADWENREHDALLWFRRGLGLRLGPQQNGIGPVLPSLPKEGEMSLWKGKTPTVGGQVSNKILDDVSRSIRTVGGSAEELQLARGLHTSLSIALSPTLGQTIGGWGGGWMICHQSKSRLGPPSPYALTTESILRD